MPFAAPLMNLELIILSEVSQKDIDALLLVSPVIVRKMNSKTTLYCAICRFY